MAQNGRKLRVAELHRARRGRDADALEPQIAHAAFEFGTASDGTCSGSVPSPTNRVGMRGDRLGDPVVGGAREPQAGLRVGPFQALMDQACAQHLDVDAHRVHLGDAVGDVAHPGQHHAGAAP